MTLRRFRLDPIVFSLRGYSKTVETEKKITEMTEPFEFSAVVTIQGMIAVISQAEGSIGNGCYKAFMKELSERGVKRVFWERHKGGEIIIKEVNIG